MCLYPWQEHTTHVFENSWVLTDAKSVRIEGNETALDEFHLNLNGIPNLFRYWVQTIHLQALSEGESVASRAQKTKALMDEIIAAVKAEKNIDLLAMETSEKASFKERAQQNFQRRILDRVKWYYDDILKILQGETAQKVSEFDAAKKIALGTIMGNYNKKISQLKGITVQEFALLKEEFRLVYSQVLPSLSAQPAEDGSLRKYLLQKDFIDGVKICNNQLDLIEVFPLVGLGVRSKLSETSPADPYAL